MHGVCFFFFKQKTAYEMRISDWSSDVCSSDLRADRPPHAIELQTSAPKASAIRGAAVSPKPPVSDPLFDFLEQPGNPDHRGRWPYGRHVGSIASVRPTPPAIGAKPGCKFRTPLAVATEAAMIGTRQSLCHVAADPIATHLILTTTRAQLRNQPQTT